MTLEDFEVLTEQKQLELLWQDAVLIGYKIEATHKVELYKMHDFFVELKYHLEFKTIRGLMILSKDEILEGYINTFTQN